MKLFRYLRNSQVDVIILIITITLVVLFFIKNPYEADELPGIGNFTPFMALLALYIFGFIWRIGVLVDLMDEHITDPQVRRQLKLGRFVGERKSRGKTDLFSTVLKMLIFLGGISIFVAFIINIIKA